MCGDGTDRLCSLIADKMGEKHHTGGTARVSPLMVVVSIWTSSRVLVAAKYRMTLTTGCPDKECCGGSRLWALFVCWFVLIPGRPVPALTL